MGSGASTATTQVNPHNTVPKKVPVYKVKSTQTDPIAFEDEAKKVDSHGGGTKKTGEITVPDGLSHHGAYGKGGSILKSPEEAW